MLLLAALGVGFSPTLALVVLCLAAAASLIPVTSGGAIANVGATAAVLLALGVHRDQAINFGLASGLLLCVTAAVARRSSESRPRSRSAATRTSRPARRDGGSQGRATSSATPGTEPLRRSRPSEPCFR